MVKLLMASNMTEDNARKLLELLNLEFKEIDGRVKNLEQGFKDVEHRTRGEISY
jgi:hypothetical protein